MAGKQITELKVANSIVPNDLIAIRKNSEEEDKAITYQNLLKSLGNTGVQGFAANSSEANKITLTTANNVSIDQYYDGMHVTFLSPIDTTDSVQIQIQSLTFKNLLIHRTGTTSILQENDYVEAIYKDGVFYQVNLPQFVYTNDYIVSDFQINQNQTLTTITLTSAYGIQKTQVYNGMSVNFKMLYDPDNVTRYDTKGLVQIKIDNIQIAHEVISSDFAEPRFWSGDIIKLIYDSTTNKFYYDTYDISNPQAVVVPSPNSNNPNDPIIIPEQNIITVTVGSGKNYEYITEAFQALFAIYGADGKKQGKQFYGNIVLYGEFTLHLNTENAKNRIFYQDLDLSWITVSGGSNDTITVKEVNNNEKFLYGKNIKGFKFKENTVIKIKGFYGQYFMQLTGTYSFKNITFDATEMSIADLLINGANITFENCIFKNFGIYLMDSTNWTEYKGEYKIFLKNCSFIKLGNLDVNFIINTGQFGESPTVQLNQVQNFAIRVDANANITILNCDPIRYLQIVNSAPGEHYGYTKVRVENCKTIPGTPSPNSRNGFYEYMVENEIK